MESCCCGCLLVSVLQSAISFHTAKVIPTFCLDLLPEERPAEPLLSLCDTSVPAVDMLPFALGCSPLLCDLVDECELCTDIGGFQYSSLPDTSAVGIHKAVVSAWPFALFAVLLFRGAASSSGAPRLSYNREMSKKPHNEQRPWKSNISLTHCSQSRVTQTLAWRENIIMCWPTTCDP